MTRLFISHCREDREIARQIKKNVAEWGFEAWLDAELPAGHAWQEEIDTEIARSAAVLLVITPEAMKSDYVLYEWAYAMGSGVPIIPLVFTNIDRDLIHPKLTSLQLIDISCPARGPDWQRLRQVLDPYEDGDPPDRLRAFMEFPARLRERTKLLRRTGTMTFERYIRGLEHTSSGFSLNDSEWALICNANFWNLLSEFQKTYKDDDGRQKSICARVTHAAAIDVWLQDEAGASISSQRVFIEAGGRIVRVFLGAEPFDTLPESYQKVMKTMQKARIDCFYKQYKVIGLVDDYTWLPELKLLMTWSTRIQLLDRINRVELSETDTSRAGELESYWSIIRSAARNLQGQTLEEYEANCECG